MRLPFRPLNFRSVQPAEPVLAELANRSLALPLTGQRARAETAALGPFLAVLAAGGPPQCPVRRLVRLDAHLHHLLDRGRPLVLRDLPELALSRLRFSGIGRPFSRYFLSVFTSRRA